MIDNELRDDPTREASRHIGAAARNVVTGLSRIQAQRANQQAAADRQEARQLRTQTDLAKAARYTQPGLDGGTDPETQLTPEERAAHTAEHAQAGARVIALDRGNLGTITDIDHDAGSVTVHFENRADGSQATRDFQWDQVQVLDDSPQPPTTGETTSARTQPSQANPGPYRRDREYFRGNPDSVVAVGADNVATIMKNAQRHVATGLGDHQAASRQPNQQANTDPRAPRQRTQQQERDNDQGR